MSQATERIHELVDRLNRYRQEYYNENAPVYPMPSTTISMTNWYAWRQRPESF